MDFAKMTIFYSKAANGFSYWDVNLKRILDCRGSHHMSQSSPNTRRTTIDKLAFDNRVKIESCAIA